MSDDKREKLREYLRNNRPKSKINLGNSSNNKENSNKNLEKDLNLDNSNLNNSRISDNKTNLNKRDYDKEPIVLNNYEMIFAMLCDILSLIFALVVTIFFDAIFKGEINEILFTVNFIVIVAFVFIYIEFIEYQKNKPKILLKNTSIEFYEKSKRVHTVKTQNVGKIICKLSSNYSSENKNYRNLIIASIIVFATVIAIFDDLFIFLLYLTFLLALMCGNIFIKFTFCIFVTKKHDRYFSIFPIIVIGKSPKKSIEQIPLYRTLIVFSKSQYSEIKDYFLNLQNINLKKD